MGDRVGELVGEEVGELVGDKVEALGDWDGAMETTAAANDWGHVWAAPPAPPRSLRPIFEEHLAFAVLVVRGRLGGSVCNSRCSSWTSGDDVVPRVFPFTLFSTVNKLASSNSLDSNFIVVQNLLLTKSRIKRIIYFIIPIDTRESTY